MTAINNNQRGNGVPDNDTCPSAWFTVILLLLIILGLLAQALIGVLSDRSDTVSSQAGQNLSTTKLAAIGSRSG